MKNLFLIGFVLLCITSCSLGSSYSDSYYESFGVVKKSANGLYIKDDTGEVLIPTQHISSFVEEGDRVWTTFTIEYESPEKDTLKIVPYRITKIMSVNLQEESDMKNVGIDLWAAWVAQSFLTFDFRVRAKNQDEIKNHDYALELLSQNKDTLFINFKHDDKGDNEGVLCRTALALNLENITYNDSLIISINYKDHQGTPQILYRTIKNEKN